MSGWPGEATDLRLELTPLSHAILEVVSLLFFALAVIGVIEVWSWVRERLAARRRRAAGETELDDRYWLYGADQWERDAASPTDPGETDEPTRRPG